MLQPVPEGYNVLNFVGFTDCGEYSQSSTYAKNDIVHKDNAAWLCLTDGTVGITPEEGKNWTIFIASENNSSGITTVDTKGIVGPAGENVSNQEIIDKLAERTINEEQKSENIVSMLSDSFSDEKTYFIGDYAIYENTLYRFTAEKTAGAWNPEAAEPTTVSNELSQLNGNMILDYANAVTLPIKNNISATISTKGMLFPYNFRYSGEGSPYANIHINNSHIAIVNFNSAGREMPGPFPVSPGDMVKITISGGSAEHMASDWKLVPCKNNN